MTTTTMISETKFKEMLADFAKAETTTKRTLPQLFAFALDQLASHRNNVFMIELLKAAQPATKAMIGAVATRCTVFRFNKEIGQMVARSFNMKTTTGQAAANEAQELADKTYNWFQTSCNSDIYVFDANLKDRPKAEKKDKPVNQDMLVAALSGKVLGKITADEFEDMIEGVIEEMREMMIFADECRDTIDGIDDADIKRLWKKKKEKK